MTNQTDYGLLQEYNSLSQKLTKYGGSSLYLVCLCGAIMNILTFSGQTYHRQTCSLYILIASACDLIHLNLGLLSNILQYGFHYDLTLTSVVYCKIKTYLVYVLTIISATLTVLAILSRYMISSTQSSRWKYNNRLVTIRCITIAIVFWVTMSIPFLFWFQRHYHSSHNEQSVCSNTCRASSCVIIELIYVCLLNGLLPPFLMMIVGFLTYKNVHRLYRRSQMKSTRVRQINEQLTSMLLFQAMKSALTSIPYSIFSCYRIVTLNNEKSLREEAKENLINEIVHLLFWSNYTSFFVYICSSSVFRHQWKKAMKQVIFCRWRKKQRHYRYYNG